MDIAFIGFGEAAQALTEGWTADRPAEASLIPGLVTADATVGQQQRRGDALFLLPDGLAAEAGAILHATGRTPT